MLGFSNVSGREEDAWLSTAFSEMLSTELAGGGKLRLVAGEEVSNLRLSSPWPQTGSLDPATTRRIGRALNSDFLVLGSYTVVGRPDHAQLRLDIRLEDSTTGEILMEGAQIGNRENLLPLVSGIGAKLRNQLGIPQLEEPDQANVLASMPSDREAARLYALGVVKLREFDALAAKDLLQQACRADRKFALCHAMLARAWSQLGYEQRRKEEAKRALDLSLNLSRLDRMQVEGDYYESLPDHDKAASAYRAMFELFPDNIEYGLQLAAAESAAGHNRLASETLAQLRLLPRPASDDPRIDLLDARVAATKDPNRLILIRSAQQKASAQGKKLVYAQARKEECLNLNYSDHPADAPAACQDAYNLYSAAGNRLGAADAIRLLGDYEGARGHLDEAIRNYQRALQILAELGEHYKTGAVLNNMAINFANQGKVAHAEELYRKAKLHFEQVGDQPDTATALGNIADIVFLRGDLSSARKLYQQALDIEASLEHPNLAYFWYRLADLNLVEGRVPEAHQLAQQGVDALRGNQGAYGYLSEALNELGAVLMAEAKLSEAHQQFRSAQELDEKLAAQGLAEESRAELAELALEEGHPKEAESLIRPAIAEFEKQKSDPASASAYTVLSRALLALGRREDARLAVEHAILLGRTSSDPALLFPAAIQQARVEMGAGGTGMNLAAARVRLLSTMANAKKLGYYQIQCEARLTLGEMEMKVNPAEGRAHLTALAADARQHGFELLARKAELARSRSANLVATSTPPS
ncbi:MAG: tetratricopeptide repeat protein [Acidobacteria bacterium]|nr:tetratricopeptide repeat protein [Acidobacteriota bacterium]